MALRRAAANRAYCEHVPPRRTARPVGRDRSAGAPPLAVDAAGRASSAEKRHQRHWRPKFTAGLKTPGRGTVDRRSAVRGLADPAPVPTGGGDGVALRACQRLGAVAASAGILADATGASTV
jgi:hypothetical protein